MFSIGYGMAVLFIRFCFIGISYQLFNKINWRKIMHDRQVNDNRALCWLLSLGIGHLVGSFFITIMEELQAMIWSAFS